MKTNYSVSEFNSENSKFGINVIDRKIENAELQGVKIDKQTAIKLLRIENICSIRKVSDRINALENAGLYVTQNPMNTGNGVVNCIKQMSNGNIRVRVSANWGGKKGNYSLCVHI